MICPSCGRENPDSTKFCGGCGASLINPGFAKTNIYLAVFYTVVTFGIYLPYWFLKRRHIINSMHSQTKLGQWPFIIAIVLFLASMLTSLAGGAMIGISYDDPTPGITLYFISNIAGIVGSIPLIMGAFRLRRIFDDHFNKHLKQNMGLSKLGTFLLNSLYFQYKINEML